MVIGRRGLAFGSAAQEQFPVLARPRLPWHPEKRPEAGRHSSAARLWLAASGRLPGRWLAQVSERLEISEYTVTVGKKEHLLLITRAGFPVVFLPEDGRKVSIHWNDEKSRALQTRQLVEEYQRQEQMKR